MKTNRIVSIFFSLLLLLFVFSCKKENEKLDNSSNNKKTYPNTITSPTFSSENDNYFSTGSNSNNFYAGNNNNAFAHGGNGQNFSGTINDDYSCLLGTWIVPPDPTLPCPDYGFHLRLFFCEGGTGHATHIDEFLCTPNMEKDFTWSLSEGYLHITFDDGDISNTAFSCPSNNLCIMWMTSNPKYLVRG